jgi:hypothetical protein
MHESCPSLPIVFTPQVLFWRMGFVVKIPRRSSVRYIYLQLSASDFHLLKSMDHFSIACSRQVCIYVVEALLVAIYLPEGKDAYIHIRPTLLSEATLVRLRPAQLNPQLPLYS